MTSYKVGYASLLAEQSFASKVIKSLEEEAESRGDVELIIRDNKLDNDQAKQNVEEFVELHVDVAILFHIDERFNVQLSDILRPTGIPLIAQDIPVPGARYFGANNEEAGILAGQEQAKWIKKHWDGELDKALVLTDSRLLERQRKRLSLAVDTLQKATTLGADSVLYIDTEINEDLVKQRVEQVFNSWQDVEHIAVVGINDEMTLTALEQANAMGRTDHVIGVGHGASMLEEGFKRFKNFLGSVAYYPEHYGKPLLDLAVRLAKKETVPPETYMQHKCITRDNVQPS